MKQANLKSDIYTILVEEGLIQPNTVPVIYSRDDYVVKEVEAVPDTV